MFLANENLSFLSTMDATKLRDEDSDVKYNRAVIIRCERFMLDRIQSNISFNNQLVKFTERERLNFFNVPQRAAHISGHCP